MSDPIQPAPVFTARLVRELKGAPLACLILLALSDQPMSNEWLCQMSGYTDKPISAALKMLASPEYQLVRRARGGWVIAKEFKLVLLDESRKNSESRNNSDSRKNSVPTTTTLIDNNLNLELNRVVVVGRKNSDFEATNPFYAENLAICQKHGIGEPSASNIADGVSAEGEFIRPEFIKAHIESLERGETVGLAIVRITNGEFPKTWQKQIDSMVYEEQNENHRYSFAFDAAE